MAEGAASMWSPVSPQNLDLTVDFDWFVRELSPLPLTPNTEGDCITDAPLFPYNMENANANALGWDSNACVYSSTSTSPSSDPRENNYTIVGDHDSSDKVGWATENSHDNGNQNPNSDSDSKRNVRLIKNREAASQSRKRKKSYIQDLESKCRMWENYCNQLQQSIAFTCAENAILRDELNRTKRQKSSNVVAEPAVHKGNRTKRQKSSNVVAEPAVHKDSLPSESPSHLITLVDAGHLTVVHYLGWLLVAFILLLTGKAVKPSSAICITRTKTQYKSSTSRVFCNILQKRRVFESFPGTRSRAFSSCRHRNWILNNSFSILFCNVI